MENKVIVLTRDGNWCELTNCFLVGASEHPDKNIYRSFLFTAGQGISRDEILTRAQDYLDELEEQSNVAPLFASVS